MKWQQKNQSGYRMTSQIDSSNSARSPRFKRMYFVLSIAIIGMALLAIRLRQPASSLQTIRQRGVLRVGYAVEAPFAFNEPDGAVTGESPELVKHVAKTLGFPRIEWIQTSFDQLIPELEADRFDVIASGLFITPERAERVLFSRPTFEAKSGLLVLLGNPRQVKSIDDVARARWIQIAVIGGAVEVDRFKDAGVAESQLIVVPDAATGRAAVQSGSVDGLALSASTVRWIAASHATEFEAVVPFEARSIQPVRQFGALAFRKDAVELRDAFDDVLNQFVGSNGHLAIIGEFGFSLNDVPKEDSAEKVLP